MLDLSTMSAEELAAFVAQLKAVKESAKVELHEAISASLAVAVADIISATERKASDSGWQGWAVSGVPVRTDDDGIVTVSVTVTAVKPVRKPKPASRNERSQAEALTGLGA
jgi:hypothetical protein